jgi:flagellar biosynthetic protein FliR
MSFTDAELLVWVQRYLWTLTRVGGVLMTAPVLGSRLAPARVRLMLTLALTVILTPLLPVPPAAEMFGAGWWLVIMQQLLIGVVIGFIMQLAFEAVMFGGEIIAYSMGLSFAQMVDPARGVSAPLVGQFLSIFVTLLFLATNGHLLLIQLISDSFHTFPVSSVGFGAAELEAVVKFSGILVSGGVRVALPMMIALLLANLAFGVMSRATPSLNLQSVGFPISLAAGLLLLLYCLPGVQGVFSDLIIATSQFTGQLLSGH